MTYNIGGGGLNKKEKLERVKTLIHEVNPDLLAIQEAIEWQASDGQLQSDIKNIAKATPFKYSYFGPTVSVKEDMEFDKAETIREIFIDYSEWVMGNAIFSKSPFIDLGDGEKLGSPKNITIYNPQKYLGSRDTEPRHIILSRQKIKSLNTNLICCHFTTLVGERLNIHSPYTKLSINAKKALKEKKGEAELLRVAQAEQIVQSINKYFNKINPVIFLAGDFNAIKSEPAIESILVGKANFKMLIPENDQVYTHIEALEPIDHIFFYPAHRLVDYKCWIIDSKLADTASDHRPIVADIKITIDP